MMMRFYIAVQVSVRVLYAIQVVVQDLVGECVQDAETSSRYRNGRVAFERLV
jgi:hypothetical protein